jgi:hypothetical protein
MLLLFDEPQHISLYFVHVPSSVCYCLLDRTAVAKMRSDPYAVVWWKEKWLGAAKVRGVVEGGLELPQEVSRHFMVLPGEGCAQSDRCCSS